jgi:serine/threonine protein kinase
MDGQLPGALGGYRIIAKLGEGGMATVYLGMALGKAKFRKLVVVKVLKEDLVSKGEFLELFLTEARLAARLSHPNIVNTFEVGEDSGRHYMAMEYLEGQSYATVIKKIGRGCFPLEHHLRILVDALGALHYAHEFVDYDGTPLGIVHRDVSPHNVFVTYDGQVKLVDFGVAKAACSDQATRAGVIKGKIAYLAPEQATGSPVDRRADIFAVGVLLWEALAGRRFASGTLDVATIHNRVTGGEPRIRDVNPDCPRDLAEICDKAIALDPRDRYATAEEFRSALEDALAFRVTRRGSVSLGNLISDAFADERSSIRTVIEQYARAADTGEIAPTIDTAKIPDMGRASTTTEASSSSSVSVGSAATKGFTGNTGSSDGPATPARARKTWITVAVAVAALALSGVLVLTTRQHHEPVASPSAPTASVSTAAPQASAGLSDNQGDTIELLVLVSPPDARVLLDGVPLTGNPIRARVPKDGRLHVVQAAADGFERAEQGVAFDADVTVKLALQRVQDAAAGTRVMAGGGRVPPESGSAAGKPASTVVAGDDLRAGGKPDKRNNNIDDKDPYAP